MLWSRRRNIALILGVGCVFVPTATVRSAEDATKPADTQAAVTEDDCCNTIRYYTLKVDNSSKLSGDGATFAVIEIDPLPANEKRSPLVARPRKASNEVSVTVSCRTNPTDSRGRKSCSDTEVHTLPGRYVFDKDKAKKHWHVDIGSENTVHISWSDYIEIIPGSGIELPQTMKVKGHARSGGGQGERGKTRCTVTCPFVEIKE